MDTIQDILEAERAALLRIARGVATREDAMILAVRLEHEDLFAPQEPQDYEPESQ